MATSDGRCEATTTLGGAAAAVWLPCTRIELTGEGVVTRSTEAGGFVFGSVTTVTRLAAVVPGGKVTLLETGYAIPEVPGFEDLTIVCCGCCACDEVKVLRCNTRCCCTTIPE